MTRLLLLELLQRAQADGKLRADLDVLHLARGAQSLLEAGSAPVMADRSAGSSRLDGAGDGNEPLGQAYRY
jgi:hypothetical protein